MPKSGDDVSRLFKSLGTDDTQFRAANKAAVHEAEQRWPLFKAVLPKKPASAPALSDQERQFWSSQERPEGGNPRKPALSLPGLSDKLADSLSKMGPKRAAKAVAPAPQRHEAEPPIPVAAASRIFKEVIAEMPPPARRSLFPKSAVAAPLKVEVEMEVAPEPVSPPLFVRRPVEPVAAVREIADDAPRDQSLSSIFSRLDQKEEPIRKSADNRPSFLGRLGKR